MNPAGRPRGTNAYLSLPRVDKESWHRAFNVPMFVLQLKETERGKVRAESQRRCSLIWFGSPWFCFGKAFHLSSLSNLRRWSKLSQMRMLQQHCLTPLLCSVLFKFQKAFEEGTGILKLSRMHRACQTSSQLAFGRPLTLFYRQCWRGTQILRNVAVAVASTSNIV